MHDPVSRALAELDDLHVPRSDIREVRRRAHPQIVARRLVASISLVAVAAAVPLASDVARDFLNPSEEGAPMPAASSTVRSPNTSHKDAPCDIPTLQPRYLPWAQDPDGIPPTWVDRGRLSSSAMWERGDGTTDSMSLSKLIYSGGDGEPGPSLPDGTAGVLHHNTDDPDPVQLPSFTVSGHVIRWSAIWSARFPDGCRSLHLIIQVEGLSEDQEREELIRIARSLVDADG